MKFALLFVLLAAGLWAFKNVLGKRDRKLAIKSTASWIVPVLVSALVTAAAIFLSINNTFKVI